MRPRRGAALPFSAVLQAQNPSVSSVCSVVYPNCPTDEFRGSHAAATGRGPPILRDSACAEPFRVFRVFRGLSKLSDRRIQGQPCGRDGARPSHSPRLRVCRTLPCLPCVPWFIQTVPSITSLFTNLKCSQMPTMSQITMPFQFVFVAMMTIVPIVNNRRSYLNRITHATRERGRTDDVPCPAPA